MAFPSELSDSGSHTRNDHTSPVGQKLGEIGNFWERCDKLADEYDQRLTKNLNENLDVLLISAGLFSAVNTSFIQMATPSLSPDNSEETNYLLRVIITKLDNTTFSSPPQPPMQGKDTLSVAANCLLYSSLCCSILAASGAMIAKEWLQSLERGGQLGTIKEQVLRRQRKFNGLRQWQLEHMIRLLPTLLLISVGLFFCGLIEYLFPIDQSTGKVATSFAIGGAIFYLLTTVMAAIWTACPYQTWVSGAIKYIVHAIASPSRTILSLTNRQGWKDFLTGLAALRYRRRQVPDREADELLGAQAACWLVETTPSLEEKYIALSNLIGLSHGVYIILGSDGIYERVLLSLNVPVIRTSEEQPNPPPVTTALRFNVDLLYLGIRLGYAGQSAKWNTAKENLAAAFRNRSKAQGARYLGNTLSSWDYSMKVVLLAMIARGDLTLWTIDRAQTWSTLWELFEEKHDDTILALKSIILSTSSWALSKRKGLVQDACTGGDIFKIFLLAIDSGSIALSTNSNTPYIQAFPLYTKILQRLGEMLPTITLTARQSKYLWMSLDKIVSHVDQISEEVYAQGASRPLADFLETALLVIQACSHHSSMHIVIRITGTAVSRYVQSSSSISELSVQTLSWIKNCISNPAEPSINLEWKISLLDLLLQLDHVCEEFVEQGAPNAVTELTEVAALSWLRTLGQSAPPSSTTDLVFRGTLVALIRHAQSTYNDPSLKTQAFDWLHRFTRKHDFSIFKRDSRSLLVAIRCSKVKGLQSQVFSLIYTQLSKLVSGIAQQNATTISLQRRISQRIATIQRGKAQFINGNTLRSLFFLFEDLEAVTNMELSLLNLLASTALGHVKRAAAAGWKLDERRDIISAGAYAINAVDTATGTAGKAFSLVIFQAILLIWDSLSEEEREEQMSETLIKATKHILLHITVIFNKCGAPTLTEALHSEIRIKTHLEEFHLPPMKLAAFIADIVNGKPGLCKSVGIECVLPAADRLLKDRCLWEYL